VDVYHIWCNLRDAGQAEELCAALEAYLTHLRDVAGLATYRVLRRKLGLGDPLIGEFHIMLEFDNLAALDETFQYVAKRKDPVERLHAAVYRRVKDLRFALYRDYPDS
jgi:hypothetical protein